MKAYVTSGIVHGGKLQVRSKQKFEQAIAQFKDGEVSVTIERKYATRSENQNAWYFGCILPLLSEHTGYTVDELHEYCKSRFNAKTVTIVDANGEIKDESRIGQTTTKLNKLTFGDYCERIREWAASDLGVTIPDPDPDWREKTEAA